MTVAQRPPRAAPLHAAATLARRLDRPPAPVVRRLLDVLIHAAAAAFVLIGAWLLIADELVIRESDHYTNAPVCAQAAQAVAGEGCTAMVPATVDSTQRHVAPNGSTHALLTFTAPQLTTGPITVDIARPPAAYYSARTGDSVSVKVWKGRVTGVYTAPKNAMRTSDSPYLSDSLDLAAGVFLVGIGLVVVLLHPPRWLAAWLTRRTRWHREEDERPGGVLARVLDDRPLGLGLLAFLALQLLDVLTSIEGGNNGLFEANPIVAALVDRIGPLGGFLGIKVPAVIALLLAVPRLPRWIARIVTWSGIAVMLYIVLQNVELLMLNHPAGIG